MKVCKIAHNGSGLCEVADYLHKLSIEAPTSKVAQKFQSKHFTRHFTKPLLSAALLSVVVWSVGLLWCGCLVALLHFCLALCGWKNANVLPNTWVNSLELF